MRCDACRVFRGQKSGEGERGSLDTLITSRRRRRRHRARKLFLSILYTHTDAAVQKKRAEIFVRCVSACLSGGILKGIKRKKGFDFWCGTFYEIAIIREIKTNRSHFNRFEVGKRVCVCVISARSRDRSAAFAATQQNPLFHLPL